MALSLLVKSSTLLPMCVAAAWLAVAPSAAADPHPPGVDGQSASAVIEDLQAKGYDVRINWLTGYDTKPLSECRVTRVNDPGHSAPIEGTFTVAYVDVVCPNGDDGGFTFGVGIG